MKIILLCLLLLIQSVSLTPSDDDEGQDPDPDGGDTDTFPEDDDDDIDDSKEFENGQLNDSGIDENLDKELKDDDNEEGDGLRGPDGKEVPDLLAGGDDAIEDPAKLKEQMEQEGMGEGMGEGMDNEPAGVDDMEEDDRTKPTAAENYVEYLDSGGRYNPLEDQEEPAGDNEEQQEGGEYEEDKEGSDGEDGNEEDDYFKLSLAMPGFHEDFYDATPREAREMMIDHFAVMDANSNDKVTMEELQAWFAAKLASELAMFGEQGEFKFADLDKDNSSSLSRDEIEPSYRENEFNATSIEHDAPFKARFEFADLNRDGSLSKNETIRYQLVDNYIDAEEYTAWMYIKDFDEDKDGKISFDEFMIPLQGESGTKQNKEIERFEKLDENKDRILDHREITPLALNYSIIGEAKREMTKILKKVDVDGDGEMSRKELADNWIAFMSDDYEVDKDEDGPEEEQDEDEDANEKMAREERAAEEEQMKNDGFEESEPENDVDDVEAGKKDEHVEDVPKRKHPNEIPEPPRDEL